MLAAMLIASRNLVPAFQFVEELQGDNQKLNELVEANKNIFRG